MLQTLTRVKDSFQTSCSGDFIVNTKRILYFEQVSLL